MLPEIQKVKQECKFHLPEQNEKGDWKVKMTIKGHCIKMTYALNKDQAEIIRGLWINSFWGFRMN